MPNRTRRTPETTSEAPSRVESSPDLGSNAALQESLAEERGGIAGWIEEQVARNVTADKVDDAATGAVDSGGDWLTGFIDEHATGEDREEILRRGEAGVSDLTGRLNEDIVGSQFGENVSGWVNEHVGGNPWVAGGLAGVGLGAYILSDQDLQFGNDFDVGDRHTFDVEGDFGSTLDPGFDAVRGGYTYDDGTHRARIEGGSRFDRDEWDVAAEYQRRMENGSTLSFGGTHRDTAGETFSTLSARYDSDDFDAFARGTYDSAADLGTFSAGFDKTGEGPDWRGRFDATTQGDWNASLGLQDQSRDGNFSWHAGVGAGRDLNGETDFRAQAGLSYRF
jgi:hypothetical protein